jgi:hypothetical protein
MCSSFSASSFSVHKAAGKRSCFAGAIFAPAVISPSLLSDIGVTHGVNFVAKSVHRPLFLFLGSYLLGFAFFFLSRFVSFRHFCYLSAHIWDNKRDEAALHK